LESLVQRSVFETGWINFNTLRLGTQAS